MPYLKIHLMDFHVIENVLVSFFFKPHSAFLARQQPFSQDLPLIVKAADTAFQRPWRLKFLELCCHFTYPVFVECERNRMYSRDVTRKISASKSVCRHVKKHPYGYKITCNKGQKNSRTIPLSRPFLWGERDRVRE